MVPVHDVRSTRELSIAGRLRMVTGGLVYGSDHEGYEAVAAGHNTAIVHRPVAVVVATSAADVAATVRCARDAGLSVAVKSTGHGAGPAPSDSILIDTRLLDSIVINLGDRTATVGAGVRWQQVLDAAAPHGLAGLAGSSTSVGVIGYTLGGGLGPIARTHGFAADHVLEMEVVTADGRLRRVTTDLEPDLYWALLGGGAAFGIVTQMTFELLPIQTLDGGGLFFDIHDAPAVVHRWRCWVEQLPETVTTSIAVVEFPSLPSIRQPLRGRRVLHLRFAYVGEGTTSTQLLAPIHAVATPLVDTVTEIMYPALAQIHLDPPQPMPVAQRSALLTGFPPEAVDTFLDTVGPTTALPLVATEIRALGGASARPPRTPNSVGGRHAPFQLHTIGSLTPSTAGAVPAALEAVVTAMAPWTSGDSLLNFADTTTTPEASSARVTAAWTPHTLTRLRSIRRTYDPTGVFAPAARWTQAPTHPAHPPLLPADRTHSC